MRPATSSRHYPARAMDGCGGHRGLQPARAEKSIHSQHIRAIEDYALTEWQRIPRCQPDRVFLGIRAVVKP